MKLEMHFINTKFPVDTIITVDLPQIKTTNKKELTNKEKAFIKRLCNNFTQINERLDTWKLKEE